MQALQKGAGGAYEPQLGFKHWKATNFIATTDLTPAELRSAYDLPINVTALGMYCSGGDPLLPSTCIPSGNTTQGDLEKYVSLTKQFAPPRLPILIWETGSSTRLLPEEEQIVWAALVEATCKKYSLLGYASFPLSPDKSAPVAVH